MKKINLTSLIFNLLLPIALAFCVFMIIPDPTQYFNSLIKPFPISLKAFSIVWPIMFILSSIAAYLIENSGHDEKKIFEALVFYYINIFVTMTYPVFFFGFQLTLFCIIWALLLIAIMVNLFIRYYKINKLSSYLLIPYFGLLVFVTYLNVSIYFLNL